MNPVKYEYKFNEGESLVSTVMIELPNLAGLLIPCNYSKWSRPGVCRCRRRQIVCCCYRKC